MNEIKSRDSTSNMQFSCILAIPPITDNLLASFKPNTFRLKLLFHILGPTHFLDNLYVIRNVVPYENIFMFCSSINY